MANDRFPPIGDVIGAPKVPADMQVAPGYVLATATQHRERKIGKRQLDKAQETLAQYKLGKVTLEERVVNDELWWQLRHWEAIGRHRKKKDCNEIPKPQPTSAWLFNAILNKHADAMDNYPEPIVLPREKTDEDSARTLSEVLPVILETNAFDEVYSAEWWEKLKHGTAVYGVFWDSTKENGIGDISVKGIDLLKIFWEPGITNIQDSRNLFIVDLVDTDILDAQYPEHAGRMAGDPVDVKQYIFDDEVDTSKKTVVVDWYYKLKASDGTTKLHYCKFAGSEILYASEDDPAYAERGFYDHGLYPVVFDTMFPEKGTPVGFGLVAVCKDPQLYIDKLFGNILDYSLKATHPRFFMSSSTGVNENELLNWEKPTVQVEGTLDETRVKQILLQPLDSLYVNIAQLKIDEMKETASNRDVNSGGTGSGVTAAAAIAALQEAGNKASRDMINSSYRANTQITKLCIELIRQFYDEKRSFRITGPGAAYRFVELSNQGLTDQLIGYGSDGITPLYRKPIFDLKIKAQKRNPFSRMEQNERAKELYGLGFFNPEKAQEAIVALEMMDFEGIDDVREKVREGQTLLNVCNQLSQQLDQAMAIIQTLTGRNMGAGAPQSAQSGARGTAPAGNANSEQGGLASSVMQAQTQMTGYGERLAKRSTPDMEAMR